MTPGKLRSALIERAKALGFDAVGIAPATASPKTLERLQSWLEQGFHGDMEWMADRPDRRASPEALWADVKSVIMIGVNYGTTDDVLAKLREPRIGNVSLYAQRKDYHETIKGRLKELAGFVAAKGGGDVKVFVDTAPVLERALGASAGIGWQGKNTMLVSRAFGTWLFLGAIYTSLAIEPDRSEQDHCGSCTRCLSVCPTDAFPEPYRLDARRCIAYLTIEHKGPIPLEFRRAIGNRIFGCDDCLAVCPWNKFASNCRDDKLALRAEMDLSLESLVELDDGAFRAFFAGTPVKRTGRDRFLRNVLIAIGNTLDPKYAPAVKRRLADPSQTVRGAAVWALSLVVDNAEFEATAKAQAPRETDADVLKEWRRTPA